MRPICEQIIEKVYRSNGEKWKSITELKVNLTLLDKLSNAYWRTVLFNILDIIGKKVNDRNI
jgi:hypothetical protein